MLNMVPGLIIILITGAALPPTAYRQKNNKAEVPKLICVSTKISPQIELKKYNKVDRIQFERATIFGIQQKLEIAKRQKRRISYINYSVMLNRQRCVNSNSSFMNISFKDVQNDKIFYEIEHNIEGRKKTSEFSETVDIRYLKNGMTRSQAAIKYAHFHISRVAADILTSNRSIENDKEH